MITQYISCFPEIYVLNWTGRVFYSQFIFLSFLLFLYWIMSCFFFPFLSCTYNSLSLCLSLSVPLSLLLSISLSCYLSLSLAIYLSLSIYLSFVALCPHVSIILSIALFLSLVSFPLSVPVFIRHPNYISHKRRYFEFYEQFINILSSEKKERFWKNSNREAEDLNFFVLQKRNWL